MKKVISFIVLLLIQYGIYSQQTHQLWTEDFDGSTVSFTKLPVTAWNANTDYYVSPPNSYYGKAPSMLGDSITFTSPTYDLSEDMYRYAYLRFDHICKISPNDSAFIEYRTDESGLISQAPWKRIHIDYYLGEAVDFRRGFSASSYPEWLDSDITAIPAQDWWKREVVDLADLVGYAQVEFRFIIKRGRVYGSNASYGWLIDNFEFIGSIYEIKPPVMEFIPPLRKDLVYGVGPWDIHAKVKTSSIHPIRIPYLKWTVNNGLTYDSIAMTSVSGDSLWKAFIPQYPISTKVIYSITGRDTAGNEATIGAEYIINLDIVEVKGSNSVAVHSIDIKDTVAASPIAQIPIIATIKNKGSANLDSVRVFYSLNGTTPVQYNAYLTPALSWDFNRQVTLGSYNPRAYGFDTITIWVSYPNGVTDSTTYDDTLTKRIYGAGDIVMEFVEVPQDTVYSTGRHNVTAKITSLSGNTVNTVSLYMASTYEESTDYDTLIMQPQGLDLWTAELPHKVFGSNVVYTAKLIDGLGYHAELAGTYYIQHPCTASEGSGSTLTDTVRIVLGRSTVGALPLYATQAYSYSQQIYLASAIGKAGAITSLAFEVATANANAPQTFDVYMGHTSKASISPETDFVPFSDLTLVYSGTYTFAATGWNDIELQTPFIYNGTDNLVVAVDKNGGGTGSGLMWYIGSPPNPKRSGRYYSSSDIDPQSPSGTYYSPSLDRYCNNITFYIEENAGGDIQCDDTNSVALEAVYPDRIANAGVNTPIQIRIRNKGTNNLDSCLISWTVNGHPVSDTTYRKAGGLPEDFTDTLTIGSYISSTGKQDTIQVWISMPNNKADVNTQDDTLTVTPFGCNIVLSGSHLIGTGGTFTDLNDALNAIRSCGVAGDVTLQLKGIYGNVDLSGFADYLQGNTLTISSYDNHPDSAVIQAMTGTGIIFDNTSNIIFDGITIDGRNSNTHVINFTGETENILFNNCNILGNLTASNTYNCFNKETTKKLNTLRVKNCLLDGGYSGFYISTDTTGRKAISSIFIDSNDIRNQYYSGIQLNYAYPNSISYNRITPRSSSQGTTWYGIDIVQGCNRPGSCEITANRIHADNSGISYLLCGLRTRSIDATLIANNEIYLHSSASTTYGIQIEAIRTTTYLHNSVLLTGPGGSNAFRALYWFTNNNRTYSGTVKNNVLVANGGPANRAYAVYLQSNISAGNQISYQFDYNNYYSSGNNLGYSGANRVNLAAWTRDMTADIHSEDLLPDFINTSTDLKMEVHRLLSCPAIAPVNEDIEKTYRRATTARGAYEFPLPSYDLEARQLYPLGNSFVYNQSVSVSVDVLNSSTGNVDSITFGWSIDGHLQPTVSWTTTSPLLTYEQRNIPVGVFTVGQALQSTEVIVWIETINGLRDTINWNDTISKTYLIQPLAEFVAPFVADTIHQLSFDVNVRFGGSGLPVSTPKMYIHTITNGIHLYDSISMVQNGSMWTANISEQYYDSKVVYMLAVSDNAGNNYVLMDSTYIVFLESRDSVMIVGMTTSSSGENPYAARSNFSYSRNYYMWHEIDPERKGEHITGISFFTTGSVASTVDNISFYFKAVTDSVNTSDEYIDPLTDGATLVWGQATANTNSTSGLLTFNLHTPFYLPPGMNLLVYCNNRDGSWTFNVPAFLTSPTGKNTSVWGYGDGGTFPPSTYKHISDERPCIILLLQPGSDLYPGYNLTVTTLTTPVNDTAELCIDNYSPVEIVVTNLGKKDYDFMQTPIDVSARIINPIGQDTVYTRKITAGTLLSGKKDAFEIAPAVPVMYAGSYDIKVWVSSSVDSIPYDDTLYAASFVINKIGMPVDDNFSLPDLSSNFKSRGMNTAATWEIIQEKGDGKDSVVASEFGTGMLRFAGDFGAVSQLYTGQIDMYGVAQPMLSFWYFHDTVAGNDYTDIKVTFDGGANEQLLKQLKRQDTAYGWRQYDIDLSAFTTKACLVILFESMSYYEAQYIDRIYLYAYQNLALDTILISPFSVCDLENKEVKVVLSNPSSQNINFSKTPTRINLRVNTQDDVVYDLNNGTLSPKNRDTITISTMNFNKSGTYDITASIMDPLDDDPSDDITHRILEINPQFAIGIEKLSGSDLAKAGFEHSQKVTIKNTGNMELSDIGLILTITSDEGDYTFNASDTFNLNLQPNDSADFTFDSAYIVPWSRN